MSTKIDGSFGIAATAAITGVKRKEAAGGAKEQSGSAKADADTLQLTGNAMQLQDIHQAVSQSSGFDAARVDALRGKIASGHYQINDQAIASRLLSFDSSLGATS